MDDDYEVRFILEGGKYRMYKLNKNMFIKRNNFIVKDNVLEVDFGEPIISPEKKHMSIKEAYNFMKKKHFKK